MTISSLTKTICQDMVIDGNELPNGWKISNIVNVINGLLADIHALNFTGTIEVTIGNKVDTYNILLTSTISVSVYEIVDVKRKALTSMINSRVQYL